MALPEFVEIDAYECSGDGIKPVKVYVSAEYSVVLKINGNPFVSIVCSGSDMKLLAVGHLVSERIIRSIDEIKEINIDEDKLEIDIITETGDEILDRLFRIHSITSGCGQGRLEAVEAGIEINSRIPVIRSDVIVSSMKTFLHTSELHSLTRGVHSAALFTAQGRRIVFFDEIGRHNAIDKIIGYAIQEGITLSDKVIMSTGRLSSEIIYKAIYASIPVIISKASPTSLSVELARKYNIMMIGKVRGGRFCIFHGVDNVK